MFDIVATLGNGAFGQVYKVKCLQSTSACENGSERVLLSQKSINKVKIAMTRSNHATGAMPNQSRSLLKDHNYVIKVIDVAKVPEEIGMEALQEIETMGTLESPYIVGYYDSFIEDQKINIVIEYCPIGDLNSYIEKQKVTGKPFVENVVWKIFIHICLGIQYLHSKDIVHRDLKSLNIFMGRENVAKVGDLGCAKHIPDPKPCAGTEIPSRPSNPPADVALAPDMQRSEDNPFELLDGNADDMLLTAGDLLLEQDQGAGLEQAGMNRKSSSQEESK